MANKRAAVYCRISSDPYGTSLGVARQEADCRKRCEENAWEVVELYVDNDKSAFNKRKQRPEFERLKTDVRLGLVDVIVVWAADRLYRQMRDLEDIIDLLEETGTELEAIQVGKIDLSNPTGRSMARMLGVVAQMESDDKSRRLRRKHQELAEAGKVGGGGARPFGYTYNRLDVVEDEAVLVREAAERVLGGETVGAIVRDWTAREIATSTGAKWSSTAMKSFLTNPRIAGKRAHKGVIVADAVWPAVLDMATWERVCALLNSPGRRRMSARSYLLSNIVTCGICGEGLRGAPHNGARGYGCIKSLGGCGGVTAVADYLEAEAERRILEVVDSAGIQTRVAKEQTARGEMAAALVQEIHTDEERLRVATEACFVHGDLDRSGYAAVQSQLQSRIDAASTRLAALTGAGVLEEHRGRVAEKWPEFNLDQKRAVIKGVIREMTLQPAIPGRPRNRFDPDRLVTHFRFTTLLQVAERGKPRTKKQWDKALDEFNRLRDEAV